MTHTLAKDLALLYSRGFGTSLEDQEDESGHATSQNDRGTGMGEGEGINDVSDQIIDEDQLLGDSAKVKIQLLTIPLSCLCTKFVLFNTFLFDSHSQVKNKMPTQKSQTRMRKGLKWSRILQLIRLA